MKEEWLFPGALVPVDVETTAALVAEIHRLIGVVGGMALAQRPWVGLTDAKIQQCYKAAYKAVQDRRLEVAFGRAIEAALKEKNT